MSRARGVSGWAALAAWIYSWSLFSEARNEFSVAGGSPPVWLLVLLGIATTSLIAGAGAALMHFRFWPEIAIVAGGLFVASVVGTQFATMRIASGSVTIGDALDASLRVRTMAGVVFISLAPTAMVASALTALLGDRRKVSEAVDV